MDTGFEEPRKLRNRKGAYAQRGDVERAAIADRDLRAAVLAKTIRELAESAPPLTEEQRLKLAALLIGGER